MSAANLFSGSLSAKAPHIFEILNVHTIAPRAYEKKRACNSQCILCMHQIVDESAGYAIFSQPRTKEVGVNTVILAIYKSALDTR